MAWFSLACEGEQLMLIGFELDDGQVLLSGCLVPSASASLNLHLPTRQTKTHLSRCCVDLLLRVVLCCLVCALIDIDMRLCTQAFSS
jgi:hypothetical protein